MRPGVYRRLQHNSHSVVQFTDPNCPDFGANQVIRNHANPTQQLHRVYIHNMRQWTAIPCSADDVGINWFDNKLQLQQRVGHTYCSSFGHRLSVAQHPLHFLRQPAKRPQRNANNGFD
jgi:hypothetical protein